MLREGPDDVRNKSRDQRVLAIPLARIDVRLAHKWDRRGERGTIGKDDERAPGFR
jgi:hypothetical protein